MGIVPGSTFVTRREFLQSAKVINVRFLQGVIGGCMARKELKEAKAIDEANVSLVKQDLGASIQYLLEMERMFDHDTRRLFEFVRVHLDSVLADRQNSAKFEEFQLFSRAFVRALFAHVEGVTYLVKQVVLWANDRGDIALTESELSSLCEGKRNTVKKNFDLAFEYFPRLFGSSYRPDKKSQGWNFFCRSIKVRDAITHPKTTMEFKLSGDAVRETQIAATWFNKTLRSLLTSCADDARKAVRPLH